MSDTNSQHEMMMSMMSKLMDDPQMAKMMHTKMGGMGGMGDMAKGSKFTS